MARTEFVRIPRTEFDWLLQLAMNRRQDILHEGIYHESDRRYETIRDRINNLCIAVEDVE